MRRVSWNNMPLRTYGAYEVTPRMRRVSWNPYRPWQERSGLGHASHEACELKFAICFLFKILPGHASHEACELKSLILLPNNHTSTVTPRMRRVSWNYLLDFTLCHWYSHASHEACELKYRCCIDVGQSTHVTPRMRRVSWNTSIGARRERRKVTPRMRRVSWNVNQSAAKSLQCRHASHEACELKCG